MIDVLNLSDMIFTKKLFHLYILSYEIYDFLF